MLFTDYGALRRVRIHGGLYVSHSGGREPMNGMERDWGVMSAHVYAANAWSPFFLTKEGFTDILVIQVKQVNHVNRHTN